MQLKIGKKLRQSRYERGFTQENMAELLKISSKTYARFEQDKAEMKLSTFIQFCQVLDKTPSELID